MIFKKLSFKENQRLNSLISSNSIAGILFVILVSIIFIKCVFPVGFVSGLSSYWLSQTEDITQYIAGFNAFFSEPWQYPLLKIKSINYPDGTLATFVDIIPIYAFMLKLLIPLSFFPFNPFGIWVALCFVMSGIAGWYVLRVAKINSWLVLFTVTILLLTFPALLARLGHISLMSHWIIIFAIALYIRSLNAPENITYWLLLLFSAFYINVYLFAMAFSIFIVSYITVFSQVSFVCNIKKMTFPILLIIISIFITMYPLPQGGIARDGGWGYYSMNLLSPFSGGVILNFPSMQMSGQHFEGYNYLGIGLLAMLFYALFLRLKLDFTVFVRHKYIFALSIVLFIYSLSYAVYFGTYHLLDISYPKFLEPIFIQYRASGRFFWAVGYLILVFSIITIVRLDKQYGKYVILVCTLIQLYDISNSIKTLHNVSNRNANIILNTDKWENIANNYNNIYFYPKFRCMQKAIPHDTLLPVMYFATLNEKNINTGYVARYQPKCDDIASEINKSDAKQSLYIFIKEEYGTEENISSFFENYSMLKCESIDFAYVCKHNNKAQ